MMTEKEAIQWALYAIDFGKGGMEEEAHEGVTQAKAILERMEAQR